MVLRRPSAVDRRQSKPYDSWDNKKLHIAFFLQNNQGAIQSEIVDYFHKLNWHTNSQNLREVLEEMESEKWIESQMHGKKMRFYKLTTFGETATQTTRDIVKPDSILKTLKAFKNLPPEFN